MPYLLGLLSSKGACFMHGFGLKKRIISLICLVVVFLIAVTTYTRLCLNQTEYTISFNSPLDDSTIDLEPSLDDITVATKEVNSLREYYNNDDIVGKLVIEGTDIDEPILKGNDNSYYLNHNPYGAYQAEGSVYQDYRTNIGDRKILVYGHSSPGWDVPFNELEKYYDKSFYDDHKYMSIYSDKGIDTYEIFSVYVEVADFTYMNLLISDETYNEYLKKYKDNSLYKTKTKVSDGDSILILQTCSNNQRYSNYKRKFLLVIGKKINKEEKR